MHIFLYGPPGTGKSTIGKIIAHNLKLPFVDLDRVIEGNTDTPIAEIMERQGEAAFRELETSALHGLSGENVVALGGGALLREGNRRWAESCGSVIVLSADIDTLSQRLHESPDKRPLLAGDLRSKLASLLETRREHYDSFPLRLDVGDNSAEQNAHRAQVLLGRHHLSSMGGYDVIVGQVADFSFNNSLILTDENVARWHLDKIQRTLPFVIIPAGEEHKNLDTISRLWKSFLDNGLDRNSTVIALGGGVVGDMAGFAASTYMRGIGCVTGRKNGHRSPRREKPGRLVSSPEAGPGRPKPSAHLERPRTALWHGGGGQTRHHRRP
jgi:shikimate kinase